MGTGDSGLPESLPKNMTVNECCEQHNIKKANYYWHYSGSVCRFILGKLSYRMYQNSNIYLPSARTGFMLTKDVINKFGRWSTFNLPEEKQEVTPFTRPINQFLDVMDEMTGDKKWR